MASTIPLTDYFPDDPEPDAPADRGRFLPGSNMQPKPFVREVVAEVMRHFGKATPPLNSEARWRLAKFWYGPDPSIHYELSLHENSSQLEIGLHAEATPERNRAFYAAFDRCMVEIQKELGPRMWLEEWDRGWVRLYETEPLWPLDTSRVSSVAERLVEVISTIQPIYLAIFERDIE